MGNLIFCTVNSRIYSGDVNFLLIIFFKVTLNHAQSYIFENLIKVCYFLGIFCTFNQNVFHIYFFFGGIAVFPGEKFDQSEVTWTEKHVLYVSQILMIPDIYESYSHDTC